MADLTFADVITFTRASTVNAWGLDGSNNPVLKSYAIDAPVENAIDPATGQALGYRALQGFTNSLLWSRTLSNAVWDATGATINQDSVGLRRTANTAWSITGADVTQDITITDDSATHTEVAYWRKDADDARLQVQFLGGTTTLDYIADLDVSTGTATAGGDATSSDITVDGVGDFWRVVLSVTNNGTGNTNKRYGLRPVTLAETAVYDFGGSFLSSSIPGPPIETEGTPVSTAADDATEPLGSEFNPNVFTHVIKCRTGSKAGGTQTIISVDDGVGTNDIVLVERQLNGTVRYLVRSGGATVIDYDFPDPGDDTDITIAYRVEQDNHAVIITGGTLQTAAGGQPTGMTQRAYGFRGFAGSAHFNSTLAEFTELDYGYSNAQLEASV